MHKQNHSILPALKHDSRLHDAVVRSRKCKRPNAQKHGVFAQAVIIPGEDRREFQELFAEFIEEWKPAGPTQRDAVFDLAETKWRKRRLQKYVQTQLSISTFDPIHPAFNELWGSLMFIGCLRSEPETCFEEHARKYLRADKIDYLKQKFPRLNYQSTPEWAQAVTYELITPGSQSPEPEEFDVDFKKAVRDFKEAAREWKAEQQVAWSITHSRELLEYEFKETERLDARIARQIKFLVELKTMQKMLYGT
jgi:hypothetical protein